MPQPPMLVQIILSGTKKGYGETVLGLMDDGTLRRISFPIHLAGTSDHYEAPNVEVLSLP